LRTVFLLSGTADGLVDDSLTEYGINWQKPTAGVRILEYDFSGMSEASGTPFPTVLKLAKSYGFSWPGYQLATEGTANAENKLRQALREVHSKSRILDRDSSLVLFGSFARHEFLEGSDYDWALLIDGVVNSHHTQQARSIAGALANAKLIPPGTSGTFGGLFFSHDLVHCIGGGADSNANLTRRMLMFHESRCFDLSPTGDVNSIWRNVVSNLMRRYFEEDVHFSAKGKRRVPRFLLNDITRYWRTICVDYAAKYREQDGKKWAIRNAKLRFSRKLLYAAGLAFCLSCELAPPVSKYPDLFGVQEGTDAGPFIESAINFAQLPPLEFLAKFIDQFLSEADKRKRVCEKIFGAYSDWLLLLGNQEARKSLEEFKPKDTLSNAHFEKVREGGKTFASGLRELFFNRDHDKDQIAELSLDYVGF
jgi:predicted nucleotidyltransferase